MSLGGLDTLSAAEVTVMARHEKVLHPVDFLRRRTMLAMLHTSETLAADEGVRNAVRLLLGPKGLTELAEAATVPDDG